MGSLNRHHSARANPDTEGRGSARSAGRFEQCRFGVDDRVACSTCGQDTYLRRRAAHSSDGEVYELQTFACRACKALTTRVVDSEGRPCTVRGKTISDRPVSDQR
jgi:hypothetical protein